MTDVRKRTRTVFAAALLVSLLGAAGCGGAGGSVMPNDTPAPAPGTIHLAPGTTIGKNVFPVGNTKQGGQGQDVGDIACDLGSEAYHVHVHLSLFANGEQIAVPAGVGFKDPVEQNGVVGDGICLYGLHTHDATGIIHVEAGAPRDFTLGQFFDVWGRALSRAQVADFAGPVTVYVDGALYEGDPRQIVFASRQQITLVVSDAPPVEALPVYAFPPRY